MNILTANDIKLRGVKSIEKILKKDEMAIITQRGKRKYIVLDIDTYDYLKKCELEALVNQAKCDVKNGDYHEETLEEHIRNISKELHENNHN